MMISEELCGAVFFNQSLRFEEFNAAAKWKELFWV